MPGLETQVPLSQPDKKKKSSIAIYFYFSFHLLVFSRETKMFTILLWMSLMRQNIVDTFTISEYPYGIARNLVKCP